MLAGPPPAHSASRWWTTYFLGAVVHLVAAGCRSESSLPLRQPRLEPDVIGLHVVRHSKHPRPGPPCTLYRTQRDRVLRFFARSTHGDAARVGGSERGREGETIS